MNKIGLLTGVLITILGMVEKLTLIFYMGIGLLLLSLLVELFKGRIRGIFQSLSLRIHAVRLQRYRKRHRGQFQLAEEWLQRLAAQYPFFVSSAITCGIDTRLKVKKLPQEREDGENILHDFSNFLRYKGITLCDEWIRIEVNRHVMRNRIAQLQTILGFNHDQKPSITDLLQLFVEEGQRMDGIKHYRSLWNRFVLQFFIESNYTYDECYAVFSQPRKMEESLNQLLQKIEHEYKTLWRLRHLEDWLLGTNPLELVSVHQFDETATSFLHFRKSIVYVLEKLGYRVTLPDDKLATIHLKIERAGISHGVLLVPLEAGHSISVTHIHEYHTARTLAGLQSIWIVTNRSFTADARTIAKKLGFMCIDRERLQEWIAQYANPFEQTS